MRVLSLIVFAVMLVGCTIPKKATYEVSQANNLGRLSVIDARNPSNPMGLNSAPDPRRQYLSENALGPPLIAILKNQLSPIGRQFEQPKSVEISGIEISTIPVDNSTGGNNNDGGGYGGTSVFVPGAGVVPIAYGPTSNTAFISVRTIIRFKANQQNHEVMEYGMSTNAKLQPEIQKVYYQAIENLAKKL